MVKASEGSGSPGIKCKKQTRYLRKTSSWLLSFLRHCTGLNPCHHSLRVWPWTIILHLSHPYCLTHMVVARKKWINTCKHLEQFLGWGRSSINIGDHHYWLYHSYYDYKWCCYYLNTIISLLCVLSHFSHVCLCNPMDCSPPGSSVHRILQARILEWVAMPSSRGSSWSRD